MVTLFLFYSGYGIYESIKSKKNYINNMPINRIFETWIKFGIAVFFFLLLSYIFNNGFGLKKIILSFVGWDSLGNSNWYIFSIIFMYILTFIAFKIFDKDHKKALIFNLVLSIIYVIIMSYHKQSYWFNTVLCYNLGLIYSYYKEQINKLLFNNFKYVLLLMVTIISFIALKNHIKTYWDYEICSILFVCSVVLLSLKIHLRSPILKWFGDNLFWIYILQRIPMIVFKEIGFNSNTLLYTISTFITTVLITFIFKYIFDKPINNICDKLNIWINKKISKKEQKED